MGLIDLLFPKYCVACKKLGSYLCTDCFALLSFADFGICIPCSRPSFDCLTHPGCRGRYRIDGAFSSIAYKGVVKKLLYAFKYKPYVSSLQELLVDLFYEGLIQKEMFHKALQDPSTGKPVLVPIPLHRSRERQRGYNQARILARGIANKLRLRVLDLLVRKKDTRAQVGLKQKDRRENVKGAFSLSPHPPAPLSGAPAGGSQYPNIFLIDDVLTTGATLSEAARILKRHGAKKVWGITLAIDQLAT